MAPKGHLPSDLHVLGLPLAFILSQDQTLLCKFVFLSSFFCLDSDLFRIDKVFYTYLSDFNLDHSLKELRLTTSLSHPLVPVVLRVQRYTLFLSLQHFFKLFFIIFLIIFIPTVNQ